MKIKIENESLFCESVTKAGLNPQEFATNLLNILDKNNVLDDIEENYGWTLGSAVAYQSVKEVIEAIDEAGIKNINCQDFFRIMNVTLYGDGDCPHCGCNMITEEERGEFLGGDGHETPYEYDYESAYICPHCGHKE